MKEDTAGQWRGRGAGVPPGSRAGESTENRSGEQSLPGAGRGLNSTRVSGPWSRPARHLCLFANLRHVLWG